MNYAKLRKFDVSNGPNIRSTLFVSGCTNLCEGCFNKELQDFNYGKPWNKEIEEEFLSYVKNENIKGVNILGGEPLDQIRDNDLLNLLKRIKSEIKKEIWLWTGYTIEEAIKNEKRKEIIMQVDVIIDGRFELKKRDLNLKYRGSSNQRILKVKELIL